MALVFYNSDVAEYWEWSGTGLPSGEHHQRRLQDRRELHHLRAHTLSSAGGQTGVRPGCSRGQTGVRPGSDRGQTTAEHRKRDFDGGRWSDPGLRPVLPELFHQHLRVAPALFVVLPARGREVFGCAFDEPALRLEVGGGLRGQRQQLRQAELARPVLDELNQLPADGLVLVRRTDIKTGQLAFSCPDRSPGRRTQRDSCRSRR